MKKIIALVLVMMFAVIAMTACSNSTTKVTPTDAPATEAATEAPAATEAATEAPAATDAPAETTAPATNG